MGNEDKFGSQRLLRRKTTEPSYESCCVGIRPPVVEDDTKRGYPAPDLAKQGTGRESVRKRSAPNGCFAPSPPGRAARSAVGRVHSDSLRIRAAGEPPPSTVPSSRGTRPTDCLARPHFRAALTVGQNQPYITHHKRSIKNN